MLYEVTFKIMTTTGNLSRRGVVVDAKDPVEAAKLADKKLKENGLPYRQVGEPRPF